MNFFDGLKKRVLSINNEDSFNLVALELFEIHSKRNAVYKKFIESLPPNFQSPSTYREIPFLPIEFFKSKEIILEGMKVERSFKSSGTSSSILSTHLVVDSKWYLENSMRIFELFYGPANDYCILSLLPSYLEREGSSLVLMANELIERSAHPLSGFYLNDLKSLHKRLGELKVKGQKTILLGVSFGLLDFIEEYHIDFQDLIVMETGGMKGRRKELIREELHQHLKSAFGINNVHSEYGMTELFSQAYSQGGGEFHFPPWMKALVRDPNDPFNQLKENEVGGINIIDLANIFSCPFIATQDLGKWTNKGFEILGRFDNSDIRGCSLLT